RDRRADGGPPLLRCLQELALHPLRGAGFRQRPPDDVRPARLVAPLRGGADRRKAGLGAASRAALLRTLPPARSIRRADRRVHLRLISAPQAPLPKRSGSPARRRRSAPRAATG